MYERVSSFCSAGMQAMRHIKQVLAEMRQMPEAVKTLAYASAAATHPHSCTGLSCNGLDAARTQRRSAEHVSIDTSNSAQPAAA